MNEAVGGTAALKWNSLSPRLYAAITVLLMVVTAIVLRAEGRLWICKCGYVKLWHGVVFSSENSQHLTDWYTFTHILHGFMYYFLIWIADRKKMLPVGHHFLGAILLACSWEMLENSNFIIERYRTQTISLDYFGDSIINSMSDVTACGFGFFLASKFRVWQSFLFVAAIEIMLLICIRDNLTINIIQLAYPIDSLKKWQQQK